MELISIISKIFLIFHDICLGFNSQNNTKPWSIIMNINTIGIEFMVYFMSQCSLESRSRLKLWWDINFVSTLSQIVSENEGFLEYCEAKEGGRQDSAGG